MSYKFLPVSTDDKTIDEIANLLSLVFPKSNKYSTEFIKWQYKNNPDGNVIGFNAYKDGILAAHYALIPLQASLLGKQEKGLLSLNTATHPDHQGKRLFITLAEMTYKLADEKGYGFVIGVANANSTYGFVNKMGFQLVGGLEAKLGFGKLRYLKNDFSKQFVRKWTKESIEWRLSNPETNYKIYKNCIYSATDKTCIKTLLFDVSNFFPMPNNAVKIGYRPIKLWLGINSSINWRRCFYINIPKGLRPSPLNFIFKDLTEENRKLDPNKVQFSAFEFDAY